MLLYDNIIDKGSTHTICQDYTKSFCIPEIDKPIICVSDGCSSISNSDIASRILTYSTIKNYYEKYLDGWFYKNPTNDIKTINTLLYDIISLAFKNYKSFFALNEKNVYDSLAATLVFAFPEITNNEVSSNKYRVVLVGDGAAVTFNKEENIIKSHKINYDIKNMPFYPYYGFSNILENISSFINEMQCKTDIYKDNTLINIIESKKTTIKQHMKEVGNFYYHTFEVDINKDSIFLMSDGIFSFIDDKKQPINEIDILNKLVNLRSFSGKFLEKRYFNGIKREFNKTRILNYDDVGIASIVSV